MDHFFSSLEDEICFDCNCHLGICFPNSVIPNGIFLLLCRGHKYDYDGFGSGAWVKI